MLGLRFGGLGFSLVLVTACAGGDSDDDGGGTTCTTDCEAGTTGDPNDADTIGDVTGQPTTSDGTTMVVIDTDDPDTGSSTSDGESSSTGDPDPFGCAALEFPVNVVDGGGYSSINAAVAAAPPAGVVQVCPGTYEEVVLVERALTLQGSGAATTIIDGAGLGTVVNINDPAGPDVTIEGLSIVGGAADATPPVSGTPCGGGVAMQGAGGPQTLTIRDTIISGNTATNGGGLCVDGTNLDTTAVVLDNVTLRDNEVTSFGGGVFAAGADFEIIDCVIEDNAALRGGGLYLGGQVDGPTITMTGGSVRRNTAMEAGGGGYFVGGNGVIMMTLAAADWGAGEREENAPDDLGCDGGTTLGFLGANVDGVCSGPPCDCTL